MKKSKIAIITYCVVFLVFSLAVKGYTTYMLVHFGVDLMNVFVGPPLIFIVFVPIILNPLAFLVQYYAKNEQPKRIWKPIVIVFRIVLVYQTVFWIVYSLDWASKLL